MNNTEKIEKAQKGAVAQWRAEQAARNCTDDNS